MPELPPQSGPVRIFLSYASEDTEAARRIADSLTAAGLETWFDKSELRGGDAWDQKIRSQIKDCQLFVPVISANTQSREEGYFRLEWHLAEQRSFLMAHDKAFIVPVVIDGTMEGSARVPDRFRERQWTRLPNGNNGAEFAARLLGLTGHVAVQAKPAPAMEPAVPAARSARSVAVLPFANLSADQDNEFFSDGISDELLTLLQGIPGLRVAARTSAFSFKGKSATTEEIGSRLGVANLVEGSVQKAGSRVKISARLSSTEGQVRWSRSFTRELSDVFALQEEIAGAIVGELKGQLSGEGTEVSSQVHEAGRGGTRNLEAYQHFLVGKHYFNRASETAVRQCIAECTKAITLDPQFALGWALLGRGYIWLCGYVTSDRATFDATLAQSRDAAERALALEPELREAVLLIAWIEFSFEFRIESARKLLALKDDWLTGDSEMMVMVGGMFVAMGDIERGRGLVKRAASLDPVNVRVRTQWCLFLVRSGDYAAARVEALAVRELGPTSIFAQSMGAFIDMEEGRFEEAELALAAAAKGWSTDWMWGLLRGGQGRTAEALDIAGKMSVEYGDTAAIQIAAVYANAGVHDQAFAWMERARQQRDPGLLNSRGFRFFEVLRADPRWPAFWSQFGFPA